MSTRIRGREVLNIKSDHREEAKREDRHAIDLYAKDQLCGHVPREISETIEIFLRYLPEKNDSSYEKKERK